jgi:hypothetical protein
LLAASQDAVELNKQGITMIWMTWRVPRDEGLEVKDVGFRGFRVQGLGFRV